MTLDNIILIYITTSSKEESEKIARELLEQHLVACCNITEKINSLYWWNGKIANDEESVLIAKTIESNFKDVEYIVQSAHSYDNPCIVSIPVVNMSKSFSEWIKNELTGN